MVPGHDLSPLPHRIPRRPPPARRHPRRAARRDRADRRRRRRRRQLQGRLHRPGHRVPAGPGPARAALPGPVGHAGRRRLQRRDGALERPGPRRDIRTALAKIARQPHVAAVEDPFHTAGRLSDDGRTAYATVSYDQTATDLDAAARDRLEDATAGLQRSGVDVAMSGEPIDGAATGGFPIGEVIGLAIAVLLLIAVLRNLRAARNALGAALRRHRPRLRRADVGRRRDRRARARARRWPACSGSAPASTTRCCSPPASRRSCAPAARPLEAAQRANATAGHSALTAAGIVLVSISGLLVTGIPFVGRAGVAAGLVVLACAIVCVVLLPARFARAGRKLLPRRERAEGGAVAPARTPARALGDQATGARARRRRRRHRSRSPRPRPACELGQPDDRNLTTDTTQRQAYDRLAEGFGPGVNGPLVVAVSLPDGTAAKPLDAAHRAARRRPRGRRRRRPGAQPGARHRRDHRHAPPRPAGRAHARARGPRCARPPSPPR